MTPKPMLDIKGLSNIKGTLQLMLEVMPDHVINAGRWAGYEDCVAGLETAATDIDHAIGALERALEAQQRILTQALAEYHERKAAERA